MRSAVFAFTLLVLSLSVFSQVPQFWGMTGVGGTYGGGTIFKINGDGSGYQLVYSFDTLSGASPQGNMVFSNGKFYGVTWSGGIWNHGVLFSFDPSNSTFTDLYDFDINSGYQNAGSLLMASNGVLYGMNTFGGVYLYGTLFSYDINTSQFSLIHEFNNFDGVWPTDNLVESADHLLYGLTAFGGTYGLGVLFSIDISNNSFVKHYSFNQSSGGDPQGDLIQASDGKFYGMTSGGGAGNYGVLFNYDPDSNVYHGLHYFDSTDGRLAVSGLLQAENGILYGLTYQGGISNKGVMFSFDPVSLSFNKLVDFTGTSNGSYPQWNLIQASDRKLYGLTYGGGIYGGGVIFSYDIDNNSFSKVKDMGRSSYGGPIGKLLEIDSSLINKVIERNSTNTMLISPNPTTSAFTLHTNVAIKNAQLRIFNSLGVQVYFTILKNSHEFISPHLNSGIYLVTLNEGEKRYVSKLIVE